MDREGFRNRLKRYKEARGLNPLLKYWEWKALPAEKETPKYEEGTGNVESANIPLWRQKATPELLEAFWTGDTQKMADIAGKQNQQVTYTSPEYTLDEVVVTAKDPNKYTEWDLAKDVASFTPGLGDAMDVYELGKSVYDGNYSLAAIYGMGLLLPNWLEKSGKFIWKGIKNIYGARKIAKALDDSSLNYFSSITKNNNIDYEPNVETLGPTVDYQMADMRHFLKSRFNKWTKHYGYEPVPLNLSIQESLNQMKDRIILHNTFVRGVRDPKQEMDYYFKHDPSDSRAELMKLAYLSTVQSLEKQGLSNTAENRMKVAASQLVGQTGHGRAGFGYNTSKGTLYTSNSLNTAGGYASYGNTAAGKVFKVQRPVDFSGDYHNWLLKGDFPLFNNSTLANHIDDTYFFQDLPYLLKTGRSLKTDTMKLIDLSFPNYIQWKNDKLDLLDTQSRSIDTRHTQLLQHTNDLFNRVFPEQKPFYKQTINSNNAIENIARYRALLELYGRLPSKPITRSGYQRTRAKLAANIYFRTYNYEKLQLLKSISGAQYQKNKLSELFRSPEYKNIKYSLLNKNDIDYEFYKPDGLYKGIFTTERKHHPKKNSNAYQHFIFVGTPGDYPVDIVEEIPQTVWGPLNSGTRAHVGESYKGLSRKSYADGGEVGDNTFMGQFGNQVSYKPEETGWWSDVKNWWNDLTGMRNYAHGNCATTPDGKHTTQCAHYSNAILRNQGYKNIVGDAWTRAAHSGMKKITSGYDGLTKPAKWDEDDAHEYLLAAAENFANKADTTALNSYDVIGLYYPDSPNTKKAFEQGKWGETQTHTGHIAIGKDGTHYVVHNVDGHLKINKLADMLTGEYEYKPVSAYRPRK